MIVNGFPRLSSPAVSREGQGFDIDEDPGVTYGRTAGILGRQLIFNPLKLGVEDSTGLGFSSSEMAGHFIAGNDFNYVRTHAEAIKASKRYNIVSASAQAIENGELDLGEYQVIDLLLGLEKDDGHSLVSYKTFTPALQTAMRAYTYTGGNLLVSGAYVGSDQQNDIDRAFLREVLKTELAGTFRDVNSSVRGLGTSFSYYRHLNEYHYAATQTDILMPVAYNNAAFPAMLYAANEAGAAVAYDGTDYKSFVMGFPFECITTQRARNNIMTGILNFLNPK